MRTALVSLATAGALCAGIGPARADQCAWLDDAAVADRAAHELARASKVIEYCEPCGDLAPGEPADVGEVSIQQVDRGAWQLLVDERGIDLAYTYVLEPGAPAYRNLAALAGCPAEGVSPSLAIADSTPTGVLIRADSTPVPAAAAPPPPAPPPPAIRPALAAPVAVPRYDTPPPQPTVIVVTHGRSPWGAMLELLLAGALVMNALLLLVLVLRRGPWRSVGLPRATKLVDRG